MTTNTFAPERIQEVAPRWWRFGYVWLVIAGPLIVVIAAIFTAILAFNSNDVIVSDNDPKTTALANYRSMVPAQTASYHAATPDAGLLIARTRAAGMSAASNQNRVQVQGSPSASPSVSSTMPETPASKAREPIQ